MKINIFVYVIYFNFFLIVLIIYKYYVFCGNFNFILKFVVIIDTKFLIKLDFSIKLCY